MKGYLRPVGKEDIDLLFAWANEPFVRQNSFSTKEISYEEHKKWFERLMEREDCRQYIYMYEDEALGQIRVTACGDTAEIGYSICKEKRGMGHGEWLLHLIARQVRQDFPEVVKLTGKVKPDNIASQKAFLKAGYAVSYCAYEVLLEKG